MPRRILALVALAAAVVFGVWGCQEYNFNPVGSCIVQPGTRQVHLSDVSAADILFLVDDSPSMDPKQQALANNFTTFIQGLTRSSVDRIAKGLAPFDFHIAVSTSSIFRNYWLGTNCVNTIQGSSTVLSCCAPATCTVGNSCPLSGGVDNGTCMAPATGGGTVCCVSPSVCDQGAIAAGKTCGHFATTFENPLPTSGCTPGLATPGTPYARGNFVSAAANPKVLHFAGLYTNCTVPTPACTVGAACGTGKMCYGGTSANACCDDKTTAINSLVAQFQQNIQVGSCGSGEEQHLEGARQAIQKALAGQQPGVAAGEWPHDGAKMVVVVVGDEDDCSNPPDPAVAIVLQGTPGNDTCVSDLNPFGVHVEYPVNDYVKFFTGLGRPFGGAFIVSANCNPTTGVCTAGTCNNTAVTPPLIGYSPAVRMLGVASGLAAAGSVPVEASVCDPFGATLAKIANLATSPSTLTLDSVPATTDVTLVRIADSSGVTRKVCIQRTTPGPVPLTCFGRTTTCTLATASTDCASPSPNPPVPCGAFTAQGWWFVSCGATTGVPDVAAGPTACIYINHDAALSSVNGCEANPGETYSAEYLGQLPPGGCTPASPTSTPSTACAQALPSADGGPSDASGWWCYGPSGGTGSCVCRTR